MLIKGKHGLAVCKKIAKNMRASENERDSTAVWRTKRNESKLVLLHMADSCWSCQIWSRLLALRIEEMKIEIPWRQCDEGECLEWWSKSLGVLTRSKFGAERIRNTWGVACLNLASQVPQQNPIKIPFVIDQTVRVSDQSTSKARKLLWA